MLAEFRTDGLKTTAQELQASGYRQQATTIS